MVRAVRRKSNIKNSEQSCYLALTRCRQALCGEDNLGKYLGLYGNSWQRIHYPDHAVARYQFSQIGLTPIFGSGRSEWYHDITDIGGTVVNPHLHVIGQI